MVIIDVRLRMTVFPQMAVKQLADGPLLTKVFTACAGLTALPLSQRVVGLGC